MDDRPELARRELKRDFQFTRHSLPAIAKAFQLLDASKRQDQTDRNGVQVAQEPLTIPQLQETHR
jgi:hypothetical protein